MEFERETTRRLHDEHMAAKALLGRLAAALARRAPGDSPEAVDSALGMLLGDLVAQFEAETPGHFGFEEEHLFPRLAAAGDGALGELLGEEHEAILPLAQGLLALAREARGRGFSAQAWAKFHGLGGELAERLGEHIEKEEAGLLPLIDDLLDDDTDAELAAAREAEA